MTAQLEAFPAAPYRVVPPPATARPKRGTVRLVARCMCCHAKVTRSPEAWADWLHVDTGKVECPPPPPEST